MSEIVYMVTDSKGRDARFFRDLKILTKSYSYVSEKSKLNISILEIKDEISLYDFIQGRIKENQRSSQLDSILNGNEEYDNIMLIRKMLEPFKNEDRYNGFCYIKQIFSILDVSGNTYKSFKSILMSRNSETILYGGPNDVEYFQLILKVHNFRQLSEFKLKRTKDSNERLKNFNLAKESLKKNKNVTKLQK
jgi:hypothetical protein